VKAVPKGFPRRRGRQLEPLNSQAITSPTPKSGTVSFFKQTHLPASHEIARSARNWLGLTAAGASQAACLVAAPIRRNLMAHQHSPRFLKLVQDVKKNIRETTVDDVKAKLDRGEKFHLVDVREESEYAKDHLPGAVHLGKGVLERDVEQQIPDTAAPIVLYCGGGFRSALAADNLQKMGYTNVVSMDGGIRDWRQKGYPLTRE
jgi:rhodanese-related sulfurtransferase